jgi:hypothetical protein
MSTFIFVSLIRLKYNFQFYILFLLNFLNAFELYIIEFD